MQADVDMCQHQIHQGQLCHIEAGYLTHFFVQTKFTMCWHTGMCPLAEPLILRNTLITDSKTIPQPESLDNGEVRALSRTRKAAFQVKSIQVKTGSRFHGGKAKASGEASTLTPRTCGRWSRPSQATEADCLHHVWGHVNRWAEHLVCSLWSPKESAVKPSPPPEDLPLSVSTGDVRRTVLRVSVSKAAGSDNISGNVLRTCANELADIFNHLDEILWRTGSPAHPKHPNQPGPSLVRILRLWIHWGCYLHCPEGNNTYIRADSCHSGHSSSTLVLEIRAPQDCVLNSFLLTLYTHDCNPQHGENSSPTFILGGNQQCCRLGREWANAEH